MYVYNIIKSYVKKRKYHSSGCSNHSIFFSLKRSLLPRHHLEHLGATRTFAHLPEPVVVGWVLYRHYYFSLLLLRVVLSPLLLPCNYLHNAPVMDAAAVEAVETESRYY
jgi:hypothetical protein